MDKLTKEGRKLCDELWRECRNDIIKECCRLADDRPFLVEDTVSDVYFCLCRAVAMGTEIHSYKNWLLKVARNIYKKHLQDLSKQKERGVSISEILNWTPYAYDLGIDDQRLNSDRIEVLAPRILDGLTETEMEIYTLVYDKEMSFKQISEKLKITESAAKQRNYRMKERVRKDIKKILEKY